MHLTLFVPVCFICHSNNIECTQICVLVDWHERAIPWLNLPSINLRVDVNLRIWICYKVEICTSDATWQMMVTDGIINLVNWLVCMFQARSWFLMVSSNMENDVAIQLQLSKGLIGESFNIHKICNLKNGETLSCNCKFWLVNSEWLPKISHLRICRKRCLFAGSGGGWGVHPSTKLREGLLEWYLQTMLMRGVRWIGTICFTRYSLSYTVLGAAWGLSNMEG